MDPWQILGVGRDASVAEIRRAYAVLLKQTRPDEDPEAFQRLVSARDIALSVAGRTASAGNARESERAQEQRLTEIVIARPEFAPKLPNLSECADRASEPHTSFLPPLGRAPDHRPKPPGSAADQSLEEGNPPPLESQALLAELEDRIPGLSVPHSPATIPAWRQIVKDLERLDFSARRQIEPFVIDELDELLRDTAGAFDLGPASPGLLEISVIVVALAEEFGWAEDDHAIHEALNNPAAAEAFKGLIARHRFIHRLHASGFPNRQDAQGLPVVDREDLESFFQKEASVHARHLVKMRAAGRWLPSFDIVALVCGLCWALINRLHTTLFVGLALIALGIVAEWGLHVTGQPRLGSGPAALWILALMHLICGFFGRNSRLWMMLEAVQSADSRYIIAPAERSAFLKHAGRRRRWPVVLFGLMVLVVAIIGAELTERSNPFSALYHRIVSIPPQLVSRSPPRTTPEELNRQRSHLEAVLRRRAETRQPNFVMDAGIDISIVEALYVETRRFDDYAAILRTLAERKIEPRLTAVLWMRVHHATKREPPGGFKVCAEWRPPRRPPAMDPARWAALSAELERPLVGAERERLDRLREMALAISNHGPMLVASRRGPDFVALLAELRERNRDPYFRIMVDQWIECGITMIWRRALE
jgi:hypothetical protein